MVFLLGGKMIFGDLMNSKPKKSTNSSSYIYSKKSFAVTNDAKQNNIVSNNCPNMVYLMLVVQMIKYLPKMINVALLKVIKVV